MLCSLVSICAWMQPKTFWYVMSNCCMFPRSPHVHLAIKLRTGSPTRLSRRVSVADIVSLSLRRSGSNVLQSTPILSEQEASPQHCTNEAVRQTAKTCGCKQLWWRHTFLVKRTSKDKVRSETRAGDVTGFLRQLNGDPPQKASAVHSRKLDACSLCHL